MGRAREAQLDALAEHVEARAGTHPEIERAGLAAPLDRDAQRRSRLRADRVVELVPPDHRLACQRHDHVPGQQARQSGRRAGLDHAELGGGPRQTDR